MRIAVGGGQEETERRLKWWAVQGVLCLDETGAHSKLMHQGLPRHGPKNDPSLLPSLEWLESDQALAMLQGDKQVAEAEQLRVQELELASHNRGRGRGRGRGGSSGRS